MARKIKVYSWQGYRIGAHPDKRWNNTTTEVVAATSVAHVMRITGWTRANLFNIGETANDEAIGVAMAEPGVVFWRGIDDRRGTWKRDDGEGS